MGQSGPSVLVLHRVAPYLLATALVAIPPCLPPVHAQGTVGDGEGKRVFESICVACHTIGAGVRIGPDLQGVTERRDREWLARFIADPEQLLGAGDSVAVALLAQYNNVRMPALGLNAQQVEAVIAFLGAGAATAPAGRPRLYLPTLALAVLAAAGITLIALAVGSKRTEIPA